jgi:hypothetical protein
MSVSFILILTISFGQIHTLIRDLGLGLRNSVAHNNCFLQSKPVHGITDYVIIWLMPSN